mgnify:CR=1 FL=1
MLFRSHKWSPGVRAWVDWIKSPTDGRSAYGHRYIGAMVADLHRKIGELTVDLDYLKKKSRQLGL